MATTRHTIRRFRRRRPVRQRRKQPLVNNAVDQMAWVASPDGQFENVSPLWQKYTGQTDEETKGWGWLQCIHPDDAPRLKDAWKTAIATREMTEAKFRLRRHDGVYRDFLGLAVPVFGKDGHLLQWVGTCVDVTVHRETEDSLFSRTTELATLFSAEKDAILIHDTDMTVRRASPPFNGRFGFDPVGLTVEEVLRRVAGRPLDEGVSPVQNESTTTGKGQVIGRRFTITRTDGAEKIVEISSYPIIDAGMIKGSIMVLKNETAHRGANPPLRPEVSNKKAGAAGNTDPARGRRRGHTNSGSLTKRETEVLALVAEGNSSREIGKQLSLSTHTVDRHRAKIMKKLNLRKAVDFLKYAISHKLVKP